MTVFAPVREAQRLWERTAPQLTLDVDALSEPQGGAEPVTPITGTSAADAYGSLNASRNSNGSGRNPALGSAAGASQE